MKKQYLCRYLPVENQHTLWPRTRTEWCTGVIWHEDAKKYEFTWGFQEDAFPLENPQKAMHEAKAIDGNYSYFIPDVDLDAGKLG